jgi:hypothetical protein
LKRTPQYRLPCGHLICETRVQIFGHALPNDPWTYRADSCILCQQEWQQHVTIAVEPPTRGVSVLSVDGGGMRAIIPLTMLKRIQGRMDLPIPIQKFFRVVGAVSSGRCAPTRVWPQIGSSDCPRQGAL